MIHVGKYISYPMDLLRYIYRHRHTTIVPTHDIPSVRIGPSWTFCRGRPPSDAIAVLMALHAARPTEDLLSFGAWEATHEKSVYRYRSPRKWVENVPKKGLQFNFRKFHHTQPLTFFQPLICWRRTGEWEIDGHLYYTWDPGSPNVRWCWKSGCIWSPPKRNARCLASISILSFGDWIVRE